MVLSRLSIERLVTDLPDPDSPTMPRRWPLLRSKDTSSTATVVVPLFSNLTLRSETLKRISLLDIDIGTRYIYSINVFVYDREL